METVLYLSAFAGLIHVLAPDHWVPSAVLSWQRGWRAPRALAFAAGAFALHTGAGFFAFWILMRAQSALPALLEPRAGHSDPVLVLAFGALLLATIARGIRYERVRHVLRAGPGGLWGLLRALTLLGPAESLVPILVKAHRMGLGCLTPLAAYLGGTLVFGLALVLFGRWLSNRPLWLARWMTFAYQRRASLPVAASVLVGLAFLARLG